MPVAEAHSLFDAPAFPVISTDAKLASAPHRGHLGRVRDRAAICLEALPDYELLELILARSIRGCDVKPRAKALIARFGSLAGVFGATLDDLKTVKGVGPTAALDLKLVHQATLRIGRCEVKRRTVIS